MIQLSVSEISESKLVKCINNEIKEDSSRDSTSSDETIQEQDTELELHTTKPGHAVNDKEILDENADA